MLGPACSAVDVTQQSHAPACIAFRAPRRGTKAKAREPGPGHEAAVQPAGASPPSSPEAAPAKAKKPRKVREPSPPPGPLYDTSMRAPKLPASEPATTVLCWNVAGLRGLLKKAGALLVARVGGHARRSRGAAAPALQLPRERWSCSPARPPLPLQSRHRAPRPSRI